MSLPNEHLEHQSQRSPAPSGSPATEGRSLPATTDVLVVGTGPTGLSVVVSLASHGHPVTMVDNQPEGTHTSRAAVVHARTLELLDQYGVAARLAAQGIHARRFTVRDRDKVLMPVPFDRLPTASLHAAAVTVGH